MNDKATQPAHTALGTTSSAARGLIEPGEILRAHVHRDASLPRVTSGSASARDGSHEGVVLRELFDVVVIGGGQAGLSVGYFLAQAGLRFVILDASERIGDPWRQRWDSLRLFTPARFDSLAGLPFPAHPHTFPTKDEMANYLESYALHFRLPVRSRARVERVSKLGSRYLVQTPDFELEAEHVVVAMSTYQRPRTPSYAQALRPDIVQLHSSEYRNPAQLRPGSVLVVGAGNSGAEIALELAKQGRPTWLAGRDVGHVPFRVDGWAARAFLTRLILRFVFHHLLTIKTAFGRKARDQHAGRGAPLIRLKPADLLRTGVQRTPRLAGTRDGLPLLDDGRVLEVANVIWCTGFEQGLSWLDLPVFGSQDEPRHDGGVVREESGLYFLGRAFLYAMSSTMIHGVARDAERITKTIAARLR